MTEPEPAKPLPADTLRLLAMVSHAYSVQKTYAEQMDLGRALKERIASLNRDASVAHGIAHEAKQKAKQKEKRAADKLAKKAAKETVDAATG